MLALTAPRGLMVVNATRDGPQFSVAEAKKWEKGVAFFLDETACIRCALCIIRCPTDAITMNRYGTVAPSIGRALPKESLDDEIHLDLTIGARKAIRPLPMYDPQLAAGHKSLDARNGNGKGDGAPPTRGPERELIGTSRKV